MTTYIHTNDIQGEHKVFPWLQLSSRRSPCNKRSTCWSVL